MEQMRAGHAPASLLIGCNPKSALDAEDNVTMATTRTAEQTKQYYVAKMGEKLGSLYYALWQEVCWLYAEWREYVEVYGTKASRIALLNEAAPSFFRLVQDGLFETTVLKIARLSDPPKSVGKPNLTVRQLPALIADKQVRDRIEASIKTATAAAVFARDWRNRRFAHRDLYLSLGLASEPLEVATREKVQASINALAELLNLVSNHYLGRTTAFEITGNLGGALTLIRILDDGLRRKAERMAPARGELAQNNSRRQNL